MLHCSEKLLSMNISVIHCTQLLFSNTDWSTDYSIDTSDHTCRAFLWRIYGREIPWVFPLLEPQEHVRAWVPWKRYRIPFIFQRLSYTIVIVTSTPSEVISRNFQWEANVTYIEGFSMKSFFYDIEISLRTDITILFF